MNFIQQLVKKYDLDEQQVTKDFAEFLTKEKQLPSNSQEGLEFLGLSQMKNRANELQKMTEQVSTEKTSSSKTQSRGAMFAKEQNEKQAIMQEASNQYWGTGE